MTLRIDPCVPGYWREFDVILRLPGSEYYVDVENPDGVNRGVKSIELDSEPVADGVVPITEHSGPHIVRVVLG